jgi:hypothetical protein
MTTRGLTPLILSPAMACRQADDRLEGGPETRKVEARARLPK